MPNTHSTLTSLFSDIADAIRAKTGGTADIVADEFPQAIESIPSGGGGDTLEIRGVSRVVIDADYEAEKVVAYLTAPQNSAEFGGGINQNSGRKVKDVTFIAETIPQVPSSVSSVYRCGIRELSVLEKIKFENIPLKTIYQSFQCVNGASYSSLKSIYGLDMRYNQTGNYIFGNAFANLDKLENVTFIPNTFGRNAIGANGNTIDFSPTKLLTDESLISIANGLCSANTKEIKFHNTQKARLALIRGDTTQRTDDFGTYDFFTAGESGTVTLEHFITQIKGWTIA